MTNEKYMKKIVYFDEESALDYLDQKNNGRLEEINRDILNKGKSFFTDAEIEAGGGVGLLANLFKFKGKGKLQGEYSREGTTVIEKTITNTILTSFTESVGNQEKTKDIERISNVTLSLVNNSLAFFKTITPIFKLFPEKIRVDDSNLKEMNIDSLDISNFDEVIDSLQGYLEFRAYNNQDKDEKIIRFNSDCLRNNYRLTDFLSMDLVIYGVKVGSAPLEQFDIANLVNSNNILEDNKQPGVSLDDFNFNQSEREETTNELEIIDVILAGIE